MFGWVVSFERRREDSLTGRGELSCWWFDCENILLLYKDLGASRSQNRYRLSYITKLELETFEGVAQIDCAESSQLCDIERICFRSEGHLHRIQY